MLYLILFLVILVLAIVLLWGLIGNVLGLILTLVVAGIVGWLADLVIPGRLPFGWLGAIAAGLIGSWLGALLFSSWGPSVAGIALLPAFIGAIIVAFIASLLFKTAGRQTY